MRTSTRLASIAACGVVAATLAACTSIDRTVAVPAPAATVAVAATPATVVPATPATVLPAAPSVAPAAAIEHGRISNIEYFPTGTAATRINIPGAIVGGVAGAAIGNQLGGGRDPATILGGAAGAAIGSQVGTTSGTVNTPYRVTIQTDAGVFRIYDVPGTGDLRVGDRVRVENGVIYRS